jgi:hypothetical protein
LGVNKSALDRLWLQGTFKSQGQGRQRVNAKLGGWYIFRPKVGKESLRQDINDSGVRIVNFATSKNLVVTSMMFPHQNIHKYTWTYPHGKTHDQIDHILINRRWHLRMLDV